MALARGNPGGQSAYPAPAAMTWGRRIAAACLTSPQKKEDAEAIELAIELVLSNRLA
jgi:hypothetical protein